MSEIIQTNKGEIREDLRGVDEFEKELNTVQKDAEIGQEKEKNQDVLEKLQEENLIKILDKYTKKNDTEINYRDDYAARTAKGEVVTTGETGIITTATQIALKHLGINPGNIDGLYGKKTIAAVNLFKSKMSITDENGIGPKTIAKIIEQLKTNTITTTITDVEKNNLLANKATAEVISEENVKQNDKKTKEKEIDKLTAVGIKSLDEIKSPTRAENTAKTITINSVKYAFYNNGEARSFDTQTNKYTKYEGKTEDVISRIKGIQEAENNTMPFHKDIYKTILGDVGKEQLSIINELKNGKETKDYLRNKTIAISGSENPYLSVTYYGLKEDQTIIGKINGHTLIENGLINKNTLKIKLKEIITEKAITETRNNNINTYIKDVTDRENYITIKELGFTENLTTKTLANNLGNGKITFEKIEKISDKIRVEIRGIDTPYTIKIKDVMDKGNMNIDNTKFQGQITNIINKEIKKLEAPTTS